MEEVHEKVSTNGSDNQLHVHWTQTACDKWKKEQSHAVVPSPSYKKCLCPAHGLHASAARTMSRGQLHRPSAKTGLVSLQLRRKHNTEYGPSGFTHP